ncbi:MAG: MFS transporter [Anaerolineae bacterium]|nr:MFS transporter [Anaerolineae bacterium]
MTKVLLEIPSALRSEEAPINAHLTERRRWLIIALVLVPVFVGSIDLTIVSAILPEVLIKLNIPIDTNLGAAAWVVTGYLLAYTVSMALMGRFSDMVGRRSAFLVCLALFIIGSWWVATAHLFPTALLNDIARRYLGQRPDLNQLTLLAVIIGRVVQALGAGAVVPVSLALVADLYPPERRAAAVGFVGAMDTLGWVLGHLYGGVMVSFFQQHGEAIRLWLSRLGLALPAPDWRTLFWLNVPLGIFAFVLMIFALRGVQHPISPGRFDLIGAFLVAAALTCLVLGLGGNTDVTGATSLEALQAQMRELPYNIPLLAAGVALIGVFLLWEWRQEHPLLELHLFRQRAVSAATLTNWLIGFLLMLGLVSVPLLINLRAENASAEAIARAAERAGILLSTLTIPMALAAVPGAWLSGKIGFRNTVLSGVLLAIIGFLLAGGTWRADTPELLMSLHLVLIGVGLGLTIAPIGTVVINAVDATRRGVASALVLIMRYLGMTIAIPSMTTYAFSRLNYMVSLARESFALDWSAEQIQRESVRVYFESGVAVIAEMLLIGALIGAVALLPALWLRGKQSNSEVKRV